MIVVICAGLFALLVWLELHPAKQQMQPLPRERNTDKRNTREWRDDFERRN